MKNSKVTVRLSEEEFDQYQKEADVCGMSTSMYVREKMKGETIEVISHGQELISVIMNMTNEILRLKEQHRNMSFDVLEREVQKLWPLLK